jgi:hypothetical protein
MSEGASSDPARAAALTATLSGTAYGVPLTIAVRDSRWLDLVIQHLPFGWSNAPPDASARHYALDLADDRDGRGVCRVSTGDATVAEDVAIGEALRRFESHARLHVAEMAEGRLFVHAGVVAYRGRALVLPGRSHTGKSTLVAELVRAGATFYSDEYLVLDAEGGVHPYAAPLSIRTTDGTLTRKVPVGSLGGNAGSDVIPVGWVIACRYRPGAPWRPRLISPGHAIIKLMSNTVAARRTPAFALETLRRAVEGARTFITERGDAFAATRCIIELIDAS